MIDTKHVDDRRTLRFETLRSVLDEAEALDAAGSLRTTGNWNAAQIVQHVTKLVDLSLDGFRAKGPLLLRMLGPIMRNRVIGRPISPGFKFSARFAYFAPDDDVTWDDALEGLRRAVARFDAQPPPPLHPSPIFGTMNHEQWEQLHCRHAELHFGFIHPQ